MKPQSIKKDIIALISLSIGIFLAGSLFSYHPGDPSLNSASNIDQVQNICGYLGALLSDLLLQTFGLTSWFLVIFNFVFSFFLFKNRRPALISTHIICAALTLVLSSTWLQIYFKDTKFFEDEILAGGVIGFGLSKALFFLVNPLGAVLVLGSLSVCLLIYWMEISLEEGLLRSFSWSKDQMEKINLFFKKRKELHKKVLNIQKHQNPERKVRSVRKKSKEIKKEVTDLTGVSLRDEQAHLDLEEEKSEEEGEEEIEKGKEAFIDEISSVTEKAFYGDESEPTGKTVSLKNRKKDRRWELPSVDLLEEPPKEKNQMTDKKIKERADQLLDKLSQLRVYGEIVGASAGPVVTLFEFRPKADIKVSSITNLDDDLSLALSSQSVRIIAPIPGKDVVGVETSNLSRETVYLKDCLASDEFWLDQYKIPAPLGKRVDGKVKIVDLASMPHLLVAGTTGSGKSVFTVSTICSLVFRHSPETLKLILIDPKQVDLTVFEDIPHLITPIIRQPKKAVNVLKWAVREMEKRYRSMSAFGARGLDSYNEIVKKLTRSQIETHIKTNEEFPGGEKDPSKSYYYEPLPYICIFIEEFGDLITIDKVNVENSVVRIAQMARACGIHLVIATQSPRKDVVTGLIKTNIPGRISFKVASKTDSRIILDEGGAERLLPKGDMLFLAPGVSKPGRHHGPWLSDKDIQNVANFWRDQWEPEYDEDFEERLENPSMPSFSSSDDQDDRYEEILDYVSTLKEVSASLIQRRFRLGYPRAARLIEDLEKNGVIGAAQGSKPRKVLT